MSLLGEILGYFLIIGVSLGMIFAFVKVLSLALNTIEDLDDE